MKIIAQRYISSSCVRVALIVLISMFTSCNTKYQYHTLEGGSRPFVIDGITFTPDFSASRVKSNPMDRSAPWNLFVTTEAPANAKSITFDTADVFGPGFNESLIPKGSPKAVTFQEVSDGTLWSQTEFEKQLNGPIAEGATIRVVLKGSATLQDRTFPFEHEFIFKSVVTTGKKYFNPLIDR